MQPSLRRLTRPAVVAALGLSLFAAACSVEEAIFTGVDAESPPGTAMLTVTRDGTSTGTVSSSPGGIDCGASCRASFPVGTAVTLTATPDTGGRFTGWSGGGCTGSAPTCTVTADAAATVAATFELAEYPVTIDLGGSGTGRVVAPAVGIDCPGTCTGMVRHGSQLSLSASAGTSSLFMGWTVGPGGTACTGTGTCATTITGPTTITATFARYQSLEVTRSGTGTGTVTSVPAGIDCGADCSETYPPGTMVTLTAAPAVGSTFTGWSGGGCSGTGTCTVTMTAATSVMATFTLNTYPLSVILEDGSPALIPLPGTVTSSPAGINCGLDCSESYGHGTPVALTATPSSGYKFAGWSGGGCSGIGTCTVTMTAATSVMATFIPSITQYTLSVGKTGTGTGFVDSSPGGISCGSDCSQAYPSGTTVTLFASPDVSSVFMGWSGACSGTGSTCTVTMTASRSVTASFSACLAAAPRSWFLPPPPCP